MRGWKNCSTNVYIKDIAAFSHVPAPEHYSFHRYETFELLEVPWKSVDGAWCIGSCDGCVRGGV